MNSVNSVKISDILWDAANIYLWDGVRSRDYYDTCDILHRFSCDAVDTSFDYKCYHGIRRPRIFEFLTSMGLNTCGSSEFSEVETIEERQQWRYAWLMFAYQYALELEEAGELAPIEF